MANPRPRSESEFVEDVLVALKKRSKALKHNHSRPEVDRWLEVIDDQQVERVEIHFERHFRQSLTLIVWSDRMVEILANKRNEDMTWKFRFALFGRALGKTEGRSLIEAVEASFSAMYRLGQDETGLLEEIWFPLLAQGPQGV